MFRGSAPVSTLSAGYRSALYDDSHQACGASDEAEGKILETMRAPSGASARGGCPVSRKRLPCRKAERRAESESGARTARRNGSADHRGVDGPYGVGKTTTSKRVGGPRIPTSIPAHVPGIGRQRIGRHPGHDADGLEIAPNAQASSFSRRSARGHHRWRRLTDPPYTGDSMAASHSRRSRRAPDSLKLQRNGQKRAVGVSKGGLGTKVFTDTPHKFS